jgi:hypothetical protein
MMLQAEAELTIKAVMVPEACFISEFTVNSQRVFGTLT